MPMDMVCNFRKCRKPLSNQAWVTTCSHAFCVEHGKREFKRNAENTLTCPACSNELRDKFDVIQADLQPNETFKSIVLAGMKPDTIMDVAMRAMSFWSYQVEQEAMYQESMAKHTREKLDCLEEIHTLNLQKIKAELETCKRKILSMQTEYNKKKKQTDELTASLEDKTRKIQKLTYQLEAHKRKGIHVPEEFDQTHHSNKDVCMDVSDLVVGQRTDSDTFAFKPANHHQQQESHDFSVCSPRQTMFNFQAKKKPQKPTFQFKPRLS